jgi:hypothetical protein
MAVSCDAVQPWRCTWYWPSSCNQLEGRWLHMPLHQQLLMVGLVRPDSPQE